MCKPHDRPVDNSVNAVHIQVDKNLLLQFIKQRKAEEQWNLTTSHWAYRSIWSCF